MLSELLRVAVSWLEGSYQLPAFKASLSCSCDAVEFCLCACGDERGNDAGCDGEPAEGFEEGHHVVGISLFGVGGLVDDGCWLVMASSSASASSLPRRWRLFVRARRSRIAPMARNGMPPMMTPPPMSMSMKLEVARIMPPVSIPRLMMTQP